MGAQIAGGLLTFLGGTAVSAINYAINRWTLRNRPDSLASMSIVRQILSVAYFATVYVLRDSLPWDMVPLLVGAAVGLTIPNILFSMRLAKKNDALNRNPREGEEENE